MFVSSYANTVDTNDLKLSNSDEHGLFEINKKSLDRFKYYGGIGKRVPIVDSILDNQDFNDYNYDDDDEILLEELARLENEEKNNGLTLAKRLDKMKYFGGIGKRTSMNKENVINNNVEVVSALRKKYLQMKKEAAAVAAAELSKKSKTSGIDKLRYMGGIGK